MRLVIILFIFGLITAIIARSKGRDFLLWWFYGIFLFPLSLIYAIVVRQKIGPLETMQQKQRRIKCPHCAEMIELDEKRCRSCGRKIDIIDV